jgi:hypothetical protein
MARFLTGKCKERVSFNPFQIFCLTYCSFYVLWIAMDWDMAIERNRVPLLRIVATLFAAIGLGQGGHVERLPRMLYRAVLSILGPAEAAVRRLIIVAARDLVAKSRPTRPAPKGLKINRKSQGRVSFRLFDTRKRFEWVHDPCRTTGERPEPHDTVNAASLCRRLAAIKHALEDLATQARRYARWRARPFERRKPKLTSPLRPGPPPGHRKKPTHEVDHILSECHWLAWSVPAPDTS